MNYFDKIPRHIAIIMDGSGRWAHQKNLEHLYGHMMGVQSIKIALDICLEYRIPYLTLYAFSTENWKRPANEVNGLMELIKTSLLEHKDAIMQNHIRIKFIGKITVLPQDIQDIFNQILELTSHHDKLTLTFAINYGAREEILNAVHSIATEVQRGTLNITDINEQTIHNHLYTSFLPDPDLLIRTSGEKRLSNFLLWQISYTEIHITSTLWPDFDREDMLCALEDYSSRKRRYGTREEK